MYLGSLPLYAEYSLSDYKAAIKTNPDNYKIYNQLGLYYIQLKDFTNAKVVLEKAVKIKRDYGLGFYNLGVLLLNQGHYNEATEDFIKSLIFDTNSYASYINLANIYNIRNDLNLSKKYYLQALVFKTNDADLYNNLGVIALKKGNYGEAETNLQKAYAIKKDDEDIKFNLATAYYYEKKYSEIKELYPYTDPSNKYYHLIIEMLNN